MIRKETIKPGMTLVYDDGREEHRGVEAQVLDVVDVGMLVQFVDRADTNFIPFDARAWMDYLSIKEEPFTH